MSLVIAKFGISAFASISNEFTKCYYQDPYFRREVIQLHNLALLRHLDQDNVVEKLAKALRKSIKRLKSVEKTKKAFFKFLERIGEGESEKLIQLLALLPFFGPQNASIWYDRSVKASIGIESIEKVKIYLDALTKFQLIERNTKGYYSVFVAFEVAREWHNEFKRKMVGESGFPKKKK